MLYYTVMYRVVSCCMVLYCIALYIASWYNTVSVVLCRVHDWPSTGLCCIVFHCTVSCCIVFRCTVLCWIMFHCTVLCYAVSMTDPERTCRPGWRCPQGVMAYCIDLCWIALCCTVPCPWLTHSGLVVDEDDGVHKVWRRVVQDAVHWPQQHWPGLVVEHSHHTERGQRVRVLMLLTPVT